MKKLYSLLIVALLLFSACNLASQNPSIVVQNYLDALVKKDPAKLISLSCKNWETEAQKELDSFMNVGASLEGLNCSIKSQSTNNATVNCQGYIQLTYDTEVQRIDLSKRTYQLTLENNDWHVCNFK